MKRCFAIVGKIDLPPLQSTSVATMQACMLEKEPHLKRSPPAQTGVLGHGMCESSSSIVPIHSSWGNCNMAASFMFLRILRASVRRARES
jgi:hypothetical protein